jgi:hypothetical protein
MPSKLNRRAEKYERMGSENPIVGIASSWYRYVNQGQHEQDGEETDQRITSQIPIDNKRDHNKKTREEGRSQSVFIRHVAIERERMSAPTPIYIIFIMIPSGPSMMELSSGTSAAVTIGATVTTFHIFFEKIEGVRLYQDLKVAANASLSYHLQSDEFFPIAQELD